MFRAIVLAIIMIMILLSTIGGFIISARLLGWF
jgi:hypothetical protein